MQTDKSNEYQKFSNTVINAIINIHRGSSSNLRSSEVKRS